MRSRTQKLEARTFGILDSLQYESGDITIGAISANASGELGQNLDVLRDVGWMGGNSVN